MKKKFREITVNGQVFGWMAKCGDDSHYLTIWKNKQIVCQEDVAGIEEITPSFVSLFIKRSYFEPQRYTHDCDKCYYLGHYEKYDLYYCSKSTIPSVIARYGNEGWNYASGMIFAHKDISIPLYEAKQRAIAFKLYSDIV